MPKGHVSLPKNVVRKMVSLLKAVEEDIEGFGEDIEGFGDDITKIFNRKDDIKAFLGNKNMGGRKALKAMSRPISKTRVLVDHHFYHSRRGPVAQLVRALDS